MRIARYVMVLLLMVLLLAPKPGWSAKEANGQLRRKQREETPPAEDELGRGEGFRDES